MSNPTGYRCSWSVLSDESWPHARYRLFGRRSWNRFHCLGGCLRNRYCKDVDLLFCLALPPSCLHYIHHDQIQTTVFSYILSGQPQMIGKIARRTRLHFGAHQRLDTISHPRLP
ncbi:hypothetical protein EV356DRAFT_165099 [Viridothelium virens]|uniref:Uncharacterized protein n=1 Tax=Viridothelium virens TaxID=1048519 RepID=A0A6A6HMX2_VIRVR|nr:hypothetical protein EV356DRAFT_165099 [Viridothelium virens]